MNGKKTRRLAETYLAAVDKVFAAVESAKQRRAALRRALRGQKRDRPQPSGKGGTNAA
jgi:hypothetical protein